MKKGFGMLEWVMGIAGIFVVAAVGYAMKNEGTTASLNTDVVAIKSDIVELKDDYKGLRENISTVVSEGVKSGVAQSLQTILKAIEENRSGFYSPAKETAKP